MERKNAWTTYEGKDLIELTDLTEDYKEFLFFRKNRERMCKTVCKDGAESRIPGSGRDDS